MPRLKLSRVLWSCHFIMRITLIVGVNNVWKDFNQTFIPENSQEIINKKINIQSIEESSLEEQAVKNMNELTSSYPSTSRAQPLLDENAGSLL